MICNNCNSASIAHHSCACSEVPRTNASSLTKTPLAQLDLARGRPFCYFLPIARWLTRIASHRPSERSSSHLRLQCSSSWGRRTDASKKTGGQAVVLATVATRLLALDLSAFFAIMPICPPAARNDSRLRHVACPSAAAMWGVLRHHNGPSGVR